eukprot:9625045-Prorocentrum_lima.AAC.1
MPGMRHSSRIGPHQSPPCRYAERKPYSSAQNARCCANPPTFLGRPVHARRAPGGYDRPP